MKICFSTLDHPITLSKDSVSVLQVTNKRLYSRICQSLLSSQGEKALEPYTVWRNDGERIHPSKAFVFIRDPFDLPITHKSIAGRLYSRIQEELLFDEDTRLGIQSLNSKLNSEILKIGLQFNADYSFAIEWDLGRYLRSFSFGLETSESTPLLDNLISFVDLVGDMKIDEALLFINIRTFLSKNDLDTLNHRLIFHGIRALMLENQHSDIYNEFDNKMLIDQHFIEYKSTYQPECTPSTQGRICSNGFGAVTF